MKRFCMILLFTCLMVLSICLSCSAESGILALPESTVDIESEAFYGAKGFERAVLPDGIESIGSRAFANTNLKYINLPSNISYIAQDAFEGCDIMAIAAKGSYAARYCDF